MDHHASLLHTLDLTETELQALLDESTHRPTDDAAAQRKHPRSAYRVSDGIVVEFVDRGAMQDCARVAPRDISSGGIGVLHRGCLEGGTPVAVFLPISQTGSAHLVSGRVVRCFCLTKDVYDVGVAFEEPIDITPILASPCNEASPHANPVGISKTTQR